MITSCFYYFYIVHVYLHHYSFNKYFLQYYCTLQQYLFPDSENDFTLFSDSNYTIPFEAGDKSHCIVIFTIEDEICEFSNCSHEYFFLSLSTINYRVNLEPSQTTIVIEEDLESQNCSKYIIYYRHTYRFCRASYYQFY